ncbi:MAG: D-alanyl-D-alanine carboxypeptidase family protein [Actinobacteria bacterium]|nr:D-alanyl-D-alanine carboxypeptidase family protein [Actinomycetota bacterium]
MAIEAVSASGSPLAAPGAAVAFKLAQVQSVTLAEMISARINSVLPNGGFVVGMRTAVSLSPLADTPPSGGSSAPHAPEELLRYGNGLVPRELLTPIGIGQHRLWGPAAESFKAMRADALAVGVNISVTDSYRTFDQQVELAQRKGLFKNGGLAAVPGTSEHGWGLAIDADVDRAGLEWLQANGARYGWVMPTTREPWHWEFHGAD